MIYVLNENGQPLMPTDRHGKVKKLLKEKKAVVVNRCPFTIKLTYNIKEPVLFKITLEIDAGSKHVGFSASTHDNEVYASQVELRNDIVNNLSTRRECRRTRRNRKTRYRKPRFNNRISTKQEGWLAPSILNKIDSHLKEVEFIYSILPITDIVVETASFDIQKLKADIKGLKKPKGTDYQEGEMFGFWNAREYVLFRDNHKCKCCNGKSGDKRLNVHHIISRKYGGDAPSNLVTLCETCHNGYHNGTVKLPKDIKNNIVFKDTVFMGIMRWAFYNKLKETYKNVSMTYGYITKNTRILNNIEKTHTADAFCISGNVKAKRLNYVYLKKKVRCHNRQLYKFKIEKGGIRKSNQAEKFVKGFKLFDKVEFEGKKYYIHGRRNKGAFVLKTLSSETKEIVPSKINFIKHQNGLIIEKIKV